MTHPRLRTVGPLPWLSYWLDLYGPDGRPGHSKVLSTIGFGLAWVVLFLWAWRAENLGSDFVFALGLVLGMPFGLNGFKAATKAKHGGAGGGSTLRAPRPGLDDPRTDDER